jgi:hypothetical protein
VNPRSNLTRRTPEGPMEKRSGEDDLAYFIIAIMFSPNDAVMHAILNPSNKRMSSPLVPACDQHRFCARPKQVAANMMWHMEWRRRESLLIPTIWLVFVLRIAHVVDRILGNRDPVTRHFTFGWFYSTRYTGPRRQQNNLNIFTLEIFARVQSLKHLQINI